jgi:hypothetical protein
MKVGDFFLMDQDLDPSDLSYSNTLFRIKKIMYKGESPYPNTDPRSKEEGNQYLHDCLSFEAVPEDSSMYRAMTLMMFNRYAKMINIHDLSKVERLVWRI